jgi:PKD repeat protein
MRSVFKALATAILVTLLVAGSGMPAGGDRSLRAPLVRSARAANVPPAIPGAAINHPRGMVPRVSLGQAPAKAAGMAAAIGYANPQCTGCSPPLLFHRGSPVMGGINGTPGQVTITPFYWAPAGFTFAASYKAIINGYLANVAADSQKSTNVFSVATQYYQQATPASSPIQHIQYRVTAGTEVDDANSYPAQGGASGCTATALPYTACVTDAALQSELGSVLTTPIDNAHLYLAFFPPNVVTCSSPGNSSCSTNTYCAYHGPTVAVSSSLLFANEPYPQDLTACADPYLGPQAPNGDAFADAQVSLVSHEASEAITDSFNAWYDSAGYENGDECAYVYGAALGSTVATVVAPATGAAYNQSVGSGKYWTQDEFSNQDFAAGIGDLNTTLAGRSLTVLGCRQREELPTASFTAPTSTNFGASTQFNGSASSDPDSTLTYSWNWGDGTGTGTGATPAHVFTTVGINTVTLTVTVDDGWTASVSHPITVNATAPGPPTALNATAGNGQVTLTWTAPASNGGSAITGYRVTPFIGGLAQTAIPTGSAATSYTVMGLANGTTYTFTVAATNGVGTGLDSSASTPVTPVAAPGPPTGVAGVAGNAQVALTWTAPTSIGGSPITGYRVTPFIGATAQTVIPTGSTATNYTVTGLVNRTTYTFKVAAVNAAGPGPNSIASSPITPILDNAGHMYLLDGYGGIHPEGTAAPLAGGVYWGWNIARSLALFPDGTGGYVLDGYGGLHPVGNANQAPQSAYWPGWDIAHQVVLAPWSSKASPAGWTLDGYGGINPFGGAPPIAADYFGWDIARGLVILPDSTPGSVAGYLLDGYGGIHPFGGAPAVSIDSYWGWDIGRGITLAANATKTNPAGWVLDGFGGLHAFGSAPAYHNSPYWGWDIGRGIVTWTGSGSGGWVLDGYGGISAFGAAPAIATSSYWGGWDIATGLAGANSGTGSRRRG